MKITRKDVAAAAGVSQSTVSFVINGRMDIAIPESTRQRVLAVVKELGYTPNKAARALVTGHSNIIVLSIPSIGSPYFANLIELMHAQLLRDGYDMVIGPYRPEEKHKRLIWDLNGLVADGAIMWGMPADPEMLHKMTESLNIPLVVINVLPSDGFDSVFIDLYSAAREAVGDLLKSGRNRTVLLTASLMNFEGERRRDAYMDAVQSAGLEPVIIEIPIITRTCAREYISDYITSNGCPDAIFCSSDDLAIGVYHGLRQLGLKIPDDVAIAGCDDLEEVKYFDVPVSSIEQPVEEMCRIAWQFLQNRIKDRSLSLQTATLPAKYIRRESSG